MNTLMFADKVLICSESEEESLERRDKQGEMRRRSGLIDLWQEESSKSEEEEMAVRPAVMETHRQEELQVQSWRCWEFGWRWAGWTGLERRRSEGSLRSSRAAVRLCAGCSTPETDSVCVSSSHSAETNSLHFTTWSQVYWSIRAAGRKRRAPEHFLTLLHKQSVWLDL